MRHYESLSTDNGAVIALDASASLTAGSQVLSAGSTTVANDLYDALTGTTSFAAIGGLGATSTSFADYAADIVSDMDAKASLASSDDTNKQAAQSAFSNALSSKTGVNLDQETARLSTLQNQYTAAAELIQVLNRSSRRL